MLMANMNMAKPLPPLPTYKSMKNSIKHLITGALLIASTTVLKADPREAEDVAYRMATTYVAKGFSMAPTDHSGVLGGGQAIRFLIPVTKGLDYVFLAGADQSAQDVDVYVYDEVGNLILDDRRSTRLAGVQFRASYNGTAMVYLNMARANGLASYYVLVGRRGAAKGGTTSTTLTSGSQNPIVETAVSAN
jgi:hypothetical protein